MEGQTGFLVDEGDEAGMADYMIQLAMQPTLAATMGQAARRHIENSFSREKSLGNLWSIMESCVR